MATLMAAQRLKLGGRMTSEDIGMVTRNLIAVPAHAQPAAVGVE